MDKNWYVRFNTNTVPGRAYAEKFVTNVVMNPEQIPIDGVRSETRLASVPRSDWSLIGWYQLADSEIVDTALYDQGEALYTVLNSDQVSRTYPNKTLVALDRRKNEMQRRLHAAYKTKRERSQFTVGVNSFQSAEHVRVQIALAAISGLGGYVDTVEGQMVLLTPSELSDLAGQITLHLGTITNLYAQRVDALAVDPNPETFDPAEGF
jgi:hypothetical protein